jgi:hypothetical protein
VVANGSVLSNPPCIAAQEKGILKMQPINYLTQVADPFAASLKGYAATDVILNAEAKRAEAVRLQQLQQQQQQQLTQERARFFTNPNPTMRDAARFASLMTPEQSKAFQPFMEGISKEQQQGFLKTSGKLLSMMQFNPEMAAKEMNTLAVASRNRGDEADASLYEQMAQAAVKPGGKASVFISLASRASVIPGAKEMFEAYDKASSTARAEAEAPADLQKKIADADAAVADANKAKVDAQFAVPLAQASLNLNAAQIKNINSEIGNRAAKLNLDKQTMQATVAEKLSTIQKNMNEMPADTRKLVNESAVTAAASKQSADQFNDLAKRLDASGGGYGVFSSASDFLKRGAGFQGGMTQLRQEYTRLRNTAAIKSLPPGPATDKDIALALKGFPSENASATDLSSFLRGMAKLQDVDASINNAKTDWLANNRGTLTRAKDTFVAGDYATKPGETFNDFAQRIVVDVSKRYDPTTQPSLVNQIPTDRNPRPAAAATDIKAQADAILRGGQ